jgi:hypothetical protein
MEGFWSDGSQPLVIDINNSVFTFKIPNLGIENSLQINAN